MTTDASAPHGGKEVASPSETHDQVTICTKQCSARCCRYITVTIERPRGHTDWDEMRWWLAHEGIMVTKDEDGWMLHVQTRCSYLQPDNMCGVYEHRMTTCSEYEAETCEFTDEVPYEVQLEAEDDLADYLEKRKLKRGAEVARAIRASEPMRRSGGLLTLQGLPTR